MWERIFTSQAFAAIASSAITTIGLIIVARISRQRAKSTRMRSVDDYAGYKQYVIDLREELKNLRIETEKKNQRFERRLEELNRELEMANRLSERRRDRLLQHSRQFNVDVSDVV